MMSWRHGKRLELIMTADDNKCDKTADLKRPLLGLIRTSRSHESLPGNSYSSSSNSKQAAAVLVVVI